MKRFFGCHVSCAGGLSNAIENGVKLGVNSIQIHPSPPQRWNVKPFEKGVEEEFIKKREGSGIEKVFFHAIYLINLANPDKQKFHLSKVSLVNYLDLCDRIHGDGVVVHVGSNKDQKSEEDGLLRAVKGINWIFEQHKGQSKLLLEVAAGSGYIIGDRMEELAFIYDKIEDKNRVGFCLDTQHMWASGYNIAENLDAVVKEINKVFGLKKVLLAHINDSKTEFNSKRDRHENLGEGTIGRDALVQFINHPQLRKIPMILETPNLKNMETARKEVEKFKRYLNIE